MRYLTALILMAFATAPGAKSQSKLLESVKSNPQEARQLCDHFKALNSQGISAGSKESISQIAQKRNLSAIDAEILSTYVIGLNCPNVR